MKKVTIIVPCYNEEENVKVFYKAVTAITDKIKDYAFTYLYIDDGSRDATLQYIKELAAGSVDVKYVSFSRNFGKEAAMYAGLEHADGDYVVIMDADLQDEPSLLPKMLESMENGYDCCATRRVNRKGEPVIRSFFARLFYKLMNRFTDVELIDGARDYRMMTRQMVDAILQVREKERFSKGIFGWVGFRYQWLEYKNVERAHGKTKFSFWKLMRYAMGGIIAFSTAPLRLLMVVGGSISAAALLFMLVKIIQTLALGVDVPGYASIVVLVSFLGGMNLFATGLVGLYLGNVYSETKNRPVYIAKEANTGKCEKERQGVF